MPDHQVTDQLAIRSLALNELAGYARPLERDECLLLVGSITEGLANADSDVDLMLIGRRGSTDSPTINMVRFDTETVQLSELAEVNVETFDSQQLLLLEPTMQATATALERPGAVKRVSILNSQEEVRLLHRLANGIPLVNTHIVEQWRTRLRVDVLPEVVALGASIVHFAHREDAISHVLEGDYDTATVCFRTSASDAAAMLLASVGETQPNPRWRLRVLRHHRESLGHERVDAIVEAMLGRVTSRDDAERLLTLFDEILLFAAERLPRVVALGGQLAPHFPVHTHLGPAKGIDDLLADAVSPPAPGTQEAPAEDPPSNRPLPAAARRLVAADSAILGRTALGSWPLAAMRTVDAGGPAGMTIDGIPSVMLSSNDYLGLRWHPKVIEAAERALREYGSSASSSRLMNGSMRLHKELEEQLAAFLGKEAALVFPTGYQANVGVTSALLGRNDVAICDKGIHASAIDGCRMAHATIRRFNRHRLDTLDRLLTTIDDGRYPASVLIADSVYSMDGDTLPLEPLLERLSGRSEPLVLIDEAHAIGVIGPGGRGLTAATARGDQVHLVTGCLSKALASIGGFVAGPAELVSAFSFVSSSSVFTTASNPAALGAALAALQVLQEEPERRHRAHAHARRLREGLRQLNLETGNSDALIVPCLIGDDERAIRLAHVLGTRGICVGCAVAPGVPPGRAILRMNVTANLTENDIDRTLETFSDVLRQVQPAGQEGK
jgi:8-amino-7-oxononanoate synthase